MIVLSLALENTYCKVSLGVPVYRDLSLSPSKVQFQKCLRWHICRVNFARKMFLSYEFSYERKLQNFPRYFWAFILWVRKNPAKFPPNSHQISLRKIKKNQRRASAGAQGEELFSTEPTPGHRCTSPATVALYRASPSLSSLSLQPQRTKFTSSKHVRKVLKLSRHPSDCPLKFPYEVEETRDVFQASKGNRKTNSWVRTPSGGLGVSHVKGCGSKSCVSLQAQGEHCFGPKSLRTET